jgi:hypothetical protein
MGRKAPLSTMFFDIFGVLFWLAAIAGIYFEETAILRPEAAGDLGAAAALIYARSNALLMGCAAAIVGTLFLGFSALIKAVCGGVEPEWRAEDHL